MSKLITLFYKMPKLKKHSRIQIETYEDSVTLKQPKEVDTEVEDAPIAFDFENPKRMKHSDRIKMLKKPKQQKDASVVPSEPSLEQPFALVCDGEMDKFMTKFTDDDEDISVIENNMKPPRRKSIKEHRNEIKTKNKMFSNLDFDREEVEQQRQESIQKLQIQIEKKQNRETHNLQKFQKKAQVFKNKLDYKDLNKDDRYKRKIQDNLKSIQDGDELDIVVEIPKIFAGNKPQVEAALFLKNSKEGSGHVQLSDYVHSQLEEDENSIPRDRKLYFVELQKQMKMKRAEQFTQSSMKECFKKSMLDDKDYIPYFDDRNREGNYQEFLESQKQKPQKFSRNQQNPICLDTSVSDSEGEEGFKKCHDVQWEVPQDKVNSTQEASHPQELQNEGHKIFQKIHIYADDSSKPSKIIEHPKKKPRQKPSRKAKSKKRSNFAFKDLIEVEAELSEDEDEDRRHRDDGEESQSDDDNDLESLIDNDVELNIHDQHALHRKFVQDSMEEEERKFEDMRKKMQKKYLEEDERLNKRMKEAARKYHIRQNKEDKEQKTENRIQKLDQGDSTSQASSSVTAEKQKNQQKFKELEQQLARETRTERQLVLGKGASKIGKLQQIQSGIMNAKKNGFKKTNRNGLKNIQVRDKSVKVFRSSK